MKLELLPICRLKFRSKMDQIKKESRRFSVSFCVDKPPFCILSAISSRTCFVFIHPWSRRVNPRSWTQRRVQEELALRMQNYGLTTQRYTEKRRESSLIWPIFEWNFNLQMGKSFNFIYFYVFFMMRGDPSWSQLIRPGLAVRVDPVRLLYLPIQRPTYLDMNHYI